MQEFGESVLIGVVLDISTTHPDGIQTLKTIKDSLLQYMIETQPYTNIYISHPEVKELPKDQGQSTYLLATYSHPSNLNIDKLFKEAIIKVGNSRHDGPKYVILFTNKFQAPLNQLYRKAFMANEIRGYNTKVCIVGIGSVYDEKSLKSLANEYNTNFFHVSNFESLSESIKTMVGMS